MRRVFSGVSLLLALFLMVGCPKKDEPKPANGDKATDNKGVAPAADKNTQAQDLIKEFKAQVEAKDYDGARATLAKLQAMGADVSAETKAEIQKLPAMLMNVGGGTTLPATRGSLPDLDVLPNR